MFSKIVKLLTTKHTPTLPTGEVDDNAIFFEYYIVFEDSAEIGYPWRWFTRKGFRHCSIFMAFEGITININQSLFNIRIYSHYLNIHEAGDILAQNPNNTVIYKPVISNTTYQNKIGTVIPTCVSLCQRITGLTYHACTPYSYYKKLLKDGGIIVAKKPKQDKRLANLQLQQAAEARHREALALEAQKDLNKRRRLGRRSLLGTAGDELGVM